MMVAEAANGDLNCHGGYGTVLMEIFVQESKFKVNWFGEAPGLASWQCMGVYSHVIIEH